MRVVAVAAQKGGVGKTTVAQCLAVEGLKAGRRVAIVDMDPQQSVAKWGFRRTLKGIPVPTVVTAGEKPVKGVLADLKNQGATLVIIDTPPLVSPQLNAALEVATAVVLVTRPNPMDLDALMETFAIVQRLRRASAAIIAQAPPAAQRARALTLTRDRLEKAGIRCCPNALTYTLSYPYAQAEALALQEREPTSKARAELAEVWGWLQRMDVL